MIVRFEQPGHQTLKYKVSFYKIHAERDGVNVLDTKCKITPLDDSYHWTVIGYAKQRTTDQYHKFVGKKIAFTRAMDKLTTTIIATKRLRAAFWNQFMREFGHLRTKKCQ